MATRTWHIAAATFVVLFILVAGNTRAEGKTSADAATKALFEEAFQQMLQDPSDIDVTLRYAELARDLGDYEAAIPPLERILMFNPELHKIKLELGIMYYKLKSYEMAEAYFQKALESEKASADVKAKSQQYLDAIAKRG